MLLMDGLVFQFPLPGGRHLRPHPLHLVEGAGQPLLEIAGLAAGPGYEFIDLTATVAAHLHFEGVF